MSLENVRARDGFGLIDSPAVSYFTLTATPQQVAAENPDRTLLIISGNASSAVYIGPTNTITSTKGYLMAGSSLAFKVIWPDDYNLPQVAWFAATTGAGVVITVIEAFMRRDPANMGFSGLYNESDSQPVPGNGPIIVNPYPGSVATPQSHPLILPTDQQDYYSIWRRRCAGRGFPDPLSGRRSSNP
jgi:hypothetical protein